MNERAVNRVGWFAAALAVVMFTSYLDQIRLNLSGNPGSIILPIATAVNCLAWVSYALLKEKKDWPMFSCNAFGVLLGLATALTAVWA